MDRKLQDFLAWNRDAYTRGGMSRRQFVGNLARVGAMVGVGVAAGGLLAGCGTGSKPAGTAPAAQGGATTPPVQGEQVKWAKELNWVEFEGVSDPALYKGWTGAHPTRINVQGLVSESAIAAQVKAGQINPDMVIVSMGYAQNFWFPTGTLLPIDTSKLSNWNQIHPFWQKASWYMDKGQLMAVPRVWGTDSIIHNTKVLPEAQTVGVLFDSKYKGKVAMPKNGVEAIAVAGMYLGAKDPFNPTDKELAEIKNLLIKQKPLVRTYWESIGDLVNLFTSGEVALAYGWLAVYTQVKKAGVPVAWANPKEGQIGWSNGTGIIKGTKELPTAMSFLDYLIGEEHLWGVYEKLGYRTTNVKVTERMKPDDRKEMGLDNPEAVLKSLVAWVTPPQERAKAMDDVWAAVLSA